jgi:glycosyltransferase involved in cell wall biosynthesis
MQAQAMGKPVVVTHLPGIAEYVKNGETGFLVKGNDPDAMAEAIDRLWQDPQRTAEMGRNARQWMAEKFSLQAYVEGFTTLIKKAVDADSTQDTSSKVEVKSTPRVVT